MMSGVWRARAFPKPTRLFQRKGREGELGVDLCSWRLSLHQSSSTSCSKSALSANRGDTVLEVCPEKQSRAGRVALYGRAVIEFDEVRPIRNSGVLCTCELYLPLRGYPKRVAVFPRFRSAPEKEKSDRVDFLA